MLQVPRTMPPAARLRDWLAALLAATLCLLLLHAFPALEMRLFAGGAARLAALFSGARLEACTEGWQLLLFGTPTLVSSACSATQFHLILSALLAWHFSRRHAFLLAVLAAPLAAFPLTLLINSVRIATVVQVHRWVIPRLPDFLAGFTHMLAGLCVFLPALLLTSLTLERLQSRARKHSVPAA